MRSKVFRLLKALSNESVKRLPYIVLVLIVMIFIQSINNSRDSKSLLLQVAQLSEDNHRLSQQNNQLLQQGVDIVTQSKNLANQSVDLSKCIGHTFATYTQNLRPVYFVDIDNCVTRAKSTSQTTVSHGPQPSKTGQSAASGSVSSTQTTTPTTPSQSVIPQPTQSQGVAGQSIMFIENLIRGLL